MKKLLAVLFAVSVFTAAYSDDKALIESQAKYLKEQTEKGNLDETIDKIPPKFLEKMAAMSNISGDELKQSMKEMTKAAMASVEIISASYDISGVEMQKSSSGRKYAFVPTNAKMKVNGKEVDAPSLLFIVEDEGKWYSMTWQPQFTSIIEEVYPDLKGIKVPQ